MLRYGLLVFVLLAIAACVPSTPTEDAELIRRRTPTPTIAPTKTPTRTATWTPTSTATPTITATPTPRPTATSAPLMNIGGAYSAQLATWFNVHCIPGDTIISLRDSDLSNITCGDRQILFNSAERDMPAMMAGARPPTVLGYDFEHRTQTPADEQADAYSAVLRMRALADRYGLVLLFAPDRAYGLQLAETIAPIVDRWAFQLQLFNADIDDIQNYLENAPSRLIPRILAVNPAIKFTMQFKSSNNAEEIEEVIESLPAAHRPMVVSLLYTDYQDVIDLSDELRISPKEVLP